MKPVAFIVTKPLQFMIASLIAEQEYPTDDVDFLIVDLFAGANDLARRLQAETSRYRNTLYFATQAEAYDHAERADYRIVHSNGDVGLRMFQTLKRLRGKSVRVYEEGIGTYRSDFYSPWKARIFELFGIGAVFGGSKMADMIYVFQPGEYREKVGAGRPVAIERSLSSFISDNLARLHHLFGMDGWSVDRSDEPAMLYLTDWHIDVEAIRDFTAVGAQMYLKPHPHVKDFRPDRVEHIKVMPAAAPAELLILELAKAHPKLTVYHHGSSAAHYLAGENIEFVDVRAAAPVANLFLP